MGRPPAVREQILRLCEKGSTSPEVRKAMGATGNSVRALISRMVADGMLFRVGSPRGLRYFTSQESANAWEAAQPKDTERQLRRRERQREYERAYHERKATGKNGIRQLLIDACSCPEGKSLSELASQFNRNQNSLSAHLVALNRDGRLHRAGPRGKGGRHFACVTHARAYEVSYAERVKEQCRKSLEQARKARYAVQRVGGEAVPVTIKPPKVRFADLPAVIPPHVKVQKIPYGVDTRYTADPSIAGRGAISADWSARRQQEMSR